MSESRDDKTFAQIFVGKLPTAATEEGIKEYFGNFGDVKTVIIKRDNVTGRSRGFAFVTFKESEHAIQAIDFEGHQINGVDIHVRSAEDRRHTILAKQALEGVVADAPGGASTVFVKGFPKASTEHDLFTYFSGFGSVDDVLIKDEFVDIHGERFATITYRQQDSAKGAAEFRSHTIRGYNLQVTRTRPKIRCAAQAPSVVQQTIAIEKEMRLKPGMLEMMAMMQSMTTAKGEGKGKGGEAPSLFPSYAEMQAAEKGRKGKGDGKGKGKGKGKGDFGKGKGKGKGDFGKGDFGKGKGDFGKGGGDFGKGKGDFGKGGADGYGKSESFGKGSGFRSMPY